MEITKKQFTGIINAILEQEERNKEISKAFDSVLTDGSNNSVYFNTPIIWGVVQALDYDDIISWWIWDGPEAGKRAEEFAILEGEDGPRIEIHDAGDLYDYIVKVKQ